MAVWQEGGWNGSNPSLRSLFSSLPWCDRLTPNSFSALEALQEYKRTAPIEPASRKFSFSAWLVLAPAPAARPMTSSGCRCQSRGLGQSVTKRRKLLGMYVAHVHYTLTLCVCVCVCNYAFLPCGSLSLFHRLRVLPRFFVPFLALLAGRCQSGEVGSLPLSSRDSVVLFCLKITFCRFVDISELLL